MLVRRDPFARQELHREERHAHGQTCYWCGGTNRRENLYEYRIETDGGRVIPYAKQWKFCSEDCRKSSET